MPWPDKVIRTSFVALFTLVPLIFLPWTSELFEFNKMVLTWLLTAVIVTAWVCRSILAKRLIFVRTPLDVPLVLFLLATLLSLVFSIDSRTSLFGYYGRWNGGLLSLASYSLLYWAFVSNLDTKYARRLIGWLLLSAGIVSLYAILQHFGIDDSLWVQDVKNRVFSTLGQPNWLAAWLVALIFIPISNILIEKNRHRLTLLYSFTLTLYIALLFTKSRSGLLAFGLSWLIYWLPLGVEPLKKRSVQALWLAIFAVFWIIKNPARDLVLGLKPDGLPAEASALAGPALETGGTESGVIRKIVWRGALAIWQSTPKNLILGTGPETFAMAYYQHRPIEHNNTSEWELLYNKAHNEFLNQLATTGLLGLSAYLLLLCTMVIQLWRARQPALFAGWASLSVTSFLGFSVVPVQLWLFLFPALAWVLAHADSQPKTVPSTPTTTQYFLLALGLAGLLLVGFNLAKYWLADIHFATSQRDLRAFSLTEDPTYIVTAYQAASQGYNLNPAEPALMTQLAETAAYLAIFTSDVDATSSATLAALSRTAVTEAMTISPAHPSHYKAASRSFILLSALDPAYLDLADSALAAAQALSPTDPRLPYQRGIIAKHQGQPEKAQTFFSSALTLKPDFTDAQAQLTDLLK